MKLDTFPPSDRTPIIAPGLSVAVFFVATPNPPPEADDSRRLYQPRDYQSGASPRGLRTSRSRVRRDRDRRTAASFPGSAVRADAPARRPSQCRAV